MMPMYVQNAPPAADEESLHGPAQRASRAQRVRVLVVATATLSLLVILIAIVAWLGVSVRHDRRELRAFKARPSVRPTWGGG